MNPIAEQSVSWLCQCGKRSWNHHESCDSCGKDRPAPPPEAEPSDMGRPDVTGDGDISGMDMGLDWNEEAQMQRADEPATTVICSHIGWTSGLCLSDDEVAPRVVAQSPKAWDPEEQMQRADEPITRGTPTQHYLRRMDSWRGYVESLRLSNFSAARVYLDAWRAAVDCGPHDVALEAQMQRADEP